MEFACFRLSPIVEVVGSGDKVRSHWTQLPVVEGTPEKIVNGGGRMSDHLKSDILIYTVVKKFKKKGTPKSARIFQFLLLLLLLLLLFISKNGRST